MRPGVDQLLRIDARGRTAGDVADVVRAGAARGKADLGQAHQHLGGFVRADLADLEIGARGDVGVAAPELRGDRRDAAELMRIEDTAWNAQPAHIRVLRRGHVEQPEKLGEEDVGPLREAPPGGHGSDRVEPIERVLLPLRLLFGDEPAAGRGGAVLGGTVHVGGSRIGRSQFFAGDGTARLHARHEALQVLLLFGREAGIAHGGGKRSGD